MDRIEFSRRFDNVTASLRTLLEFQSSFMQGVIDQFRAEISDWEDASGLEYDGASDGVTPDDLRNEIARLRKAEKEKDFLLHRARAIRQFCLNKCGGSDMGVLRCTASNCPLWPWRLNVVFGRALLLESNDGK